MVKIWVVTVIVLQVITLFLRNLSPPHPLKIKAVSLFEVITAYKNMQHHNEKTTIQMWVMLERHDN
jgi:hypothetical protein